MPGTNTDRITFIYNGAEYDATEYADKHPGGRPFIDNMKAERKDFT
jgi:cytochrome b involved in lipid metabolism